MRTMFFILSLMGSAAAQGTAYNYCQATHNSFGTIASISYLGSLSLSSGTFELTVTGCPPVPDSYGMFTFGQTQYNVPFGHGYLCIQPFTPAIFRMTPQHLFPGTLTKSIQSEPQEFAAFQPSSSWNFQFWYRNPAAGGPNFNLSDALHVDFAP